MAASVDNFSDVSLDTTPEAGMSTNIFFAGATTTGL